MVSEGFAYVAGDTAGVQIVDVSQPSAPTAVGLLAVNEDIRGMVAVGNHIYLADRKNGLRIVEAQEKASPIQIGYYDTLGPVDGIAVLTDEGADALAFVASGGNLRTLRLPRNAAPVITGYYETAGKAEDVAIDKTTLPHDGTPYYLAVAEAPRWQGQDWSTTGMAVYQVDDAQRLTEVTFLPLKGETHKLDIEGDTVYVASGSGGVRMLAFSDPTTPRESGYYVPAAAVLDVAAIDQDCLYMTTGSQVIDLCKGNDADQEELQTPLALPTPGLQADTEPLKQGLKPLTRKRIDMHALGFSDGALYFADTPMEDSLLEGNRNQTSRLRTIASEMTNREDATEVLATTGQIQGVTRLGSEIYIADGDGGIVILGRVPVPGSE